MDADGSNGLAVVKDADAIDGEIDELGFVARLAVEAGHGDVVRSGPRAACGHEGAEVRLASGDGFRTPFAIGEGSDAFLEKFDFDGVHLENWVEVRTEAAGTVTAESVFPPAMVAAE